MRKPTLLFWITVELLLKIPSNDVATHLIHNTCGNTHGAALATHIRYSNRRKKPPTQKLKSGPPGLLLAAILSACIAGYYGSDYLPDFATAATGGTPLRVVNNTAAIVGRASVIDGDTIEIHGERIRFNGVDAPESAQLCKNGGGQGYHCGAKSADGLQAFLAASSPTRCEFVERDQYDRFVGNCSRADGSSVQRWLVKNGHAMDWPRYSGGAYASEQAAAKSKKLGIWSGNFEPPWEWRLARREAPVAAPIAPLMSNSAGTDCRIKGNISAKGERIYHVPGQEHYSKTQISKSKGERWFCSEAEARSAGWRRSRR